MKAQPGDRYDRWTVLREGPRGQNGRLRRVWCACHCGREKLVYVGSLGSGKSAGCMHCAATKHGVTRSGDVPPEYRSWQSMVRRCTDPSAREYANYGGRGIAVCERWLSDVRAFVADMGPRPSLEHSLDRIDNNGNYEPANCRWATKTQQARNTRANRIVTAFGAARCIAEWAELVGLPYSLVLGRLDRGWPAELALTSPASFKRKRVQEFFTEVRGGVVAASEAKPIGVPKL